MPLAPLLRQAFRAWVSTAKRRFCAPKTATQYRLPSSALLEPGGFVALSDRSPAADACGLTAVGSGQKRPGEPIARSAPTCDRSTCSGAAVIRGRLETHPPLAASRHRAVAYRASLSPSSRAACRGDPAWRGLRLFTGGVYPLPCHQPRGRTGRPDLNVPHSIVEYRPPEQIRALHRRSQPLSLYGSMPAHPHLDAADLDALLACFAAMKSRFDPDARANHPPATP